MKQILLIVVLALLLGLLAGCGASDSIVDPQSVIDVTGWTWEKNPGEGTITFNGTATNITEKSSVYDMGVYVDVIDADKNSICTDTYDLDGKVLNPGESTAFEFEITCDPDNADGAGLGMTYSWN